jgi:regulator of protease activity HflC (stomatin/prohibitin superfamily)
MGFIAGPLVLLMLQNRGIKYNIPENHLAVLFVHGRKQLVVQGQSFNVRPEQGQTLQFFNLREQTKPFPHTCDTADQIRVNLEVELRWLHMPATMFLYLDSTDDPPSAIAAAVKAELTTQISRCDYALAMKNLKIIAMRTTTAASIKAVQYGLQVNSVYIKSVKIDAASSAAREEASRINALNDAVNKASDKTLDFVLKTRDDKTKDDTKKD